MITLNIYFGKSILHGRTYEHYLVVVLLEGEICKNVVYHPRILQALSLNPNIFQPLSTKSLQALVSIRQSAR